MATQAPNGPRWRNSPFSKGDDTPSPGPAPGHARSRSTVTSSPLVQMAPSTHARNQSLSDMTLGRTGSKRLSKSASPAPGTFAPRFIKTEALAESADKVGGIEGENDFSGKRYVWIKDPATAFVRGWVVEELDDGMLRVQCDDNSVREQLAVSEPSLTHCSNEMSMATPWTRSIQPSSTKQTTWPS